MKVEIEVSKAELKKARFGWAHERIAALIDLGAKVRTAAIKKERAK